MGIISAIGHSVAENHSALAAGNCGITVSAGLSSRYSGILPFGAIGIRTDELIEKFKPTDAGITRTTLLTLHAFADALEDARLSREQLGAFDTALVGGTTVGGMCLSDELYRDSNGGGGSASGTETEGSGARSAYLSSYDGAAAFLYLQDRYDLHGLVTTINTACSSSANAIQYGARLIKNGLARRAIVGGADSLAKFTINGFNALQILSPEICRPFDQHREGLNLGEGAAFLVLEKEEDLAGKKVYAEVSGYCNANDAFHPSSLSAEGDGPYAAMKGALECAHLNREQIGFINAHGTGTDNNDVAESRAMIRLFGEPPAFASTKSNTGHTLGASGAIEAVYSILSLFHQELYGSLNFASPIVGTGLVPVQGYQKKSLQHVMSNSFGFGGNCTSLIFSKVN